MHLNCILTATILMQAVASAINQVQTSHHQQPLMHHYFKRSSSNLGAPSSQVPCPMSCTCKWSSGKLSAFCDSQNLISIPIGIDSEIQILDLSKNNFQTLPPRVFQERKLTNLQRINLSFCNLGYIADDAFLQLTNLVELDLDSNLLTKIPQRSTKECKQLRKLHLSHNPITSIDTDSFISLTELIVLDLSNCQIDNIEPMAFHGLRNLKELKLNDNRLTTLTISAVSDLPTNIFIDLTQNRWNCDCNLRAVREWYIHGGIQSTLQPTCSLPAKMSDVMWASPMLEEFACAPEVIPGNTDMTVPASNNISLSCAVKASLPVTFVWFQDEKKDERNLTPKKNQSEPQSTQLLEERRYDIFETVGPPNFPNVSTSILTLHNLKPSDSSTFLCWVENKAGYSITNFTLTVTEPGLVADMWLPWSKRADGTYIIFIIFLISMALTILIVILLVRIRKKKVLDNDHDMKPTPKIRHCSISSVDDGGDSTSTDSSDSSTRKPQISSIGLDVIEHMKTGIINMDYHSMSPIIQFNTINNENEQFTLSRKNPPNEINIQQPNFNHLSINYNNQSANSSYNCDLTSTSTIGYHSDYNSGYSEEPNPANNYNMAHQTSLSHEPQNLININSNNNITLMGSAMDHHHLSYHPSHYTGHHHLNQQPPDITMVHGQHQYDANNLANIYNQNLSNGVEILANDSMIPVSINSELALPGYAINDTPNYSNDV